MYNDLVIVKLLPLETELRVKDKCDACITKKIQTTNHEAF